MPLLPGIVSSTTTAQVALPTTGDPHWNNVILLLNYNSSTTTSDILNDASGNVSAITGSHSITTPSPALGAAWGNAFTTTSNTQLASYAMTDNSLWEFTGALTIEFWVYHTSYSTAAGYLAKRTSSSTNGFSMGPLNVSGTYYIQGTLYVADTARQIITDVAMPSFINAWHHVAMTRDSAGWIRIFVDGVMRGKSDAAYTGTILGNTVNFVLSRQSSNAGSGITGKMDDVRITRNVCRYGSDDGFSVPTEPFWYPT